MDVGLATISKRAERLEGEEFLRVYEKNLHTFDKFKGTAKKKTVKSGNDDGKVKCNKKATNHKGGVKGNGGVSVNAMAKGGVKKEGAAKAPLPPSALKTKKRVRPNGQHVRFAEVTRVRIDFSDGESDGVEGVDEEEDDEDEDAGEYVAASPSVSSASSGEYESGGSDDVVMVSARVYLDDRRVHEPRDVLDRDDPEYVAKFGCARDDEVHTLLSHPCRLSRYGRYGSAAEPELCRIIDSVVPLGYCVRAYLCEFRDRVEGYKTTMWIPRHWLAVPNVEYCDMLEAYETTHGITEELQRRNIAGLLQVCADTPNSKSVVLRGVEYPNMNFAHDMMADVRARAEMQRVSEKKEREKQVRRQRKRRRRTSFEEAFEE